MLLTDIKRFVSRGSSKSNLEQLKALKATLKSSLDVTAQDLQQSVLTYVNADITYGIG